MYKSDIKEFGEMALLYIVLVIILLALIAIPSFFISCKQAEIYNKRNNTNYTCSDFFWAEDQINKQTQQIEINSLDKLIK